MLLVISPAKSQDTSSIKVKGSTQPRSVLQSAVLVDRLAKMKPKALSKLMDISPALAELDHERFQEWDVDHSEKVAKPAVFLFRGEVYRGLDAGTLSSADLRFATDHLRILSGLYGILRPLDRIRPHRLEMGTRIKIGRTHKDLYSFWAKHIPTMLEQDVEASGSSVLVDLASVEYAKAMQGLDPTIRVIKPVFQDKVSEGYRSLMTYAKHQRGALARFVVQERITEPERMKEYTGNGYRFSPSRSTGTDWVFIRSKKP